MTDENKVIFNHSKGGPEDMLTEKEAWDHIGRVALILNGVGFMQHEILHSPWGAEVLRVQKEVITGILNNCSLCGGETEEAIKIAGKAARENQELYSEFMVAEVNKLALAIQCVKLEDLLGDPKDMRGPEDSIGDIKDSPAITGLIDKLKAEKGDDFASYTVVKPHRLIQEIIGAGTAMAGGQEEFADFQAIAIKNITEDMNNNPATILALQLSGALIMSISKHFTSPVNMSSAVLAPIEAVKHALRTTSIMALADWSRPQDEVYLKVAEVGARALGEKLAAVANKFSPSGSPLVSETTVQSRPLESDAPDNMKPTSTMFPGNRSVN